MWTDTLREREAGVDIIILYKAGDWATSVMWTDSLREREAGVDIIILYKAGDWATSVMYYPL